MGVGVIFTCCACKPLGARYGTIEVGESGLAELAHRPMTAKERQKRGFAAMSPEKQKSIASQGGKAAHAAGTAHEFTSEEAREAGKKGGESVSKDREHMAEIGRKGGQAVSQDRSHMANIGRKGGANRSKKR